MSDAEDAKSAEEVLEDAADDEDVEDVEEVDDEEEEAAADEDASAEEKPVKKAKASSEKKQEKPAAAGGGSKKKKTSKSSAPRRVEDYFCQEARSIAAQLEKGKPEERDQATGEVISPHVPPMPGIPDNEDLEGFKELYSKMVMFTGEETQDASRFIILHKERATAYGSLIENTSEQGEDGKCRDLAVTPPVPESRGSPAEFQAWRDALQQEGMLVTAAHHRIIMDKQTKAVYWLLDATRLEAAGRHFLASLRGHPQLKTSCTSQLAASRKEYKERGHSLEEQDASDYSPENLNTHIFVQLCNIQKRTIYPEARAFLHGIGDAKNKLRMYNGITCLIPSHILIPHLCVLIDSATRRKGSKSGSGSGGGGKAPKTSASSETDASKNKRPPRPKMSTQKVQEPVVRPATNGDTSSAAAASKLLSIAAAGSVPLDSVEKIKGEYLLRESEASTRLKTKQDNLIKVLSTFCVRTEGQATSAEREPIEELAMTGAPAKYIERLFGHPDQEERKKRVKNALASANKCVKEPLRFETGADDEDEATQLSKLREQAKSLNEQLDALAEVYSTADDAKWRELLKESDGRTGPTGPFAGWLAAPGKRSLARKFFMPALLLGADIVDGLRLEAANKLAGVISGLLEEYEKEAINYKGTVTEFAEICIAASHKAQHDARVAKEAADKALTDLEERVADLSKDLKERTKQVEEGTAERNKIKKDLAAVEKELADLKAASKKEAQPAKKDAPSKPKAIPPDPKPAEKRKDPPPNGKESAKSEDAAKKSKPAEEKKGEKRKDPAPPSKTPATTKSEPAPPAPKKAAVPAVVEEEDGGF